MQMNKIIFVRIRKQWTIRKIQNIVKLIFLNGLWTVLCWYENKHGSFHEISTSVSWIILTVHVQNMHSLITLQLKIYGRHFICTANDHFTLLYVLHGCWYSALSYLSSSRSPEQYCQQYYYFVCCGYTL